MSNEIIPAGDERKLLADTIMPGASDDEIRFFAQVCNRMSLDPFRREIYAVKRRVQDGDRWVERWVFQTGIDGYRKRAAATGAYAGSEVSTFPEDADRPAIATATVWRMVDGQRVPFTAKARWTEYVQTNKSGQPLSMWAKMPHTMLEKVAEAKALRRAFPDELGNVLSEEEMGQADNPSPVQPVKAAPVANPFRAALEAKAAAPEPPAAPQPSARDSLNRRLMDAMQADDITEAQLNAELSSLYRRELTHPELSDAHIERILAPEKWAVIVANIHTPDNESA